LIGGANPAASTNAAFPRVLYWRTDSLKASVAQEAVRRGSRFMAYET
jgi:hypothetical protein